MHTSANANTSAHVTSLVRLALSNVPQPCPHFHSSTPAMTDTEEDPHDPDTWHYSSNREQEEMLKWKGHRTNGKGSTRAVISGAKGEGKNRACIPEHKGKGYILFGDVYDPKDPPVPARARANTRHHQGQLHLRLALLWVLAPCADVETCE